MKSRSLSVRSERGSYDVLIGRGLLGTLGDTVAGVTTGRAVALITDSNVDGLYGDAAAASLEAAGARVERLVVPAGERSKSWDVAGETVAAMSARGIERDDVVVALGGGVVGDLAGFCAATYMRGIGIVQVPTTLLAQVDSSIGGKTGVDLPMGKNLAGAFWPPLAVVADTGCLSTLPDAEWRSGMAEVAKSSILDGEAAVAGLERDIDALAARKPAAVERAVLMAAGLKARVVSADERESAGREALNYGHTLGHAIERVAGYGAVPHGAAVAEGMRFAGHIAETLSLADPEWTLRQDGLLRRLGLPAAGCPYSPGDLLAAMRADKKVRAGAVRFILSREPGVWEALVVPDETLSSALDEWCCA